MYIELQVLCILTLGIMLFRVVANPNRSSQQTILAALLVSCMGTFALDGLWAPLADNPDPRAIATSYAFNIAYYIALGTSCFFWFLFSEAQQESTLFENRVYKALAGGPLLLLVILTITSPATGAIFFIDDTGTYHRGRLHFMQLGISYGYLVLTGAKAFILAQGSDDWSRSKRLYIVSSYVVPVLIASILQMLIPGLPAICAGATLSLLFIYISLQDQQINTDPLTRVSNRNQLMANLADRIHDAQAGQGRFALVLMDVDNFKQINDRYGHVEGDRALIRVAAALRDVNRKRGSEVYRYGGDEFMVIFPVHSDTDLERMQNAIRDDLQTKHGLSDAPYPLTLSYGCVEWDESMRKPHEVIRQADQKLYDSKHNRVTLWTAEDAPATEGA